MKKFAKAFLPKPLQKELWMFSCWIRGADPLTADRISFSGDYADWDSAIKNCSGYDAPQILEKVLAATRKVKRGEADFERDSVTFDKVDPPWHLLSCVLCAAAEQGGRLRLVDFGGSLGSSYFQTRAFLKHLPEVCWCVVEQPHFVSAGREFVEDEQLRFFGSVDEVLAEEPADILLLSSVLAYLPEPHKTLGDLLSRNWKYVVLDRTGFLASGLTDRLTVQRVPASIYEAAYPAWFLAGHRVMQNFSANYNLLIEWNNTDRFELAGDQIAFKGMFFRQKEQKSELP